MRVVGVEAELHDDHPREAERAAQALDRLGDDAEVLGDQRQRAELARGGVEDGPPGAAAPAPAARVGRALGHRPVGDEAAEMIDPGDIEERERASQALGPPAVAALLQRRPVIQRVAPQLAAIAVGVGRRARDVAGAKQLRPSAVVGAAGRDVDRDVADQPHAARDGVGAQRAPLAGEADLVGDRAATASDAFPVAESNTPHGPGTRRARRLTRAPRGRPAGRARPRTRTRPCTASERDRAVRAAASATTTGPRRRANRRSGRRRRQAAQPPGWLDAAVRPLNGLEAVASRYELPETERVLECPRRRPRNHRRGSRSRSPRR